MSAVDEIKARIDIVDLVSESGVKLRRSGRNYMGFCPFHDNKHTPSFAVWPETGTWYCFGECHEGGDIFKFVMKKEGMDFKEALEYLAEKAGVKLEDYRRETPRQKESFERLYALLEDAVIYFHNQLLQTPAGKPALAYLRDKRGLRPETIEAFGLGYAPAGWDNIQKHFTARGYEIKELLAVGLIRPRDSGGYYDTFRHRVMIPIRDPRGHVVGFGARALSADEPAKYINSPQTELFNKGNLLYGLDRARKAIRQAGEVIVVEGYMDVIGLHQAGYANAVAPMGTALTEDQFRLLKRYTRRVILALDPDEAGRKAILRGLEAARGAMDRETEAGFDPRGLLRYESRFKADLRVVTLPDALDPDELVLQDEEKWRDLLKNARPIVRYVMETLVAEQDVRDAKVKGEIARKVLPLIDDVVDPVEQASYRQLLARLLQIDERVLLAYRPGETVRPSGRRAGKQAAEVSRRAAARPSQDEQREALLVSALYRHPDLYFQLNNALRFAELQALSARDFVSGLYQQAFTLLSEGLIQVEEDLQDYVLQRADASLRVLVKNWLDEGLQIPDMKALLKEIYRTVLQLRRSRADETLKQLRLAQESAEKDDAALIANVMEQLALIARLDRALANAPFEKDRD